MSTHSADLSAIRRRPAFDTDIELPSGALFSIALPVLTKVGGQPLWLMQLWQSQLGLGGALW